MTIEVTNFSVTPLLAKTGDKISVDAKLNCTNYIDKCSPISITIKVNGQTVKTDTFQPSYYDWSGTPYTTTMSMPSTNAYVEVTFQEDNRISREASIINTYTPINPPGSGGTGLDNTTTGYVAIGVGAIVLFLLYDMLKR